MLTEYIEYTKSKFANMPKDPVNKDLWTLEPGSCIDGGTTIDQSEASLDFTKEGELKISNKFGSVLWSSLSKYNGLYRGNGNKWQLCMNTQGGVKVQQASGTKAMIWTTLTETSSCGGQPGKLVFANGNLVVYDASSQVLWESGTMKRNSQNSGKAPSYQKACTTNKKADFKKGGANLQKVHASVWGQGINRCLCKTSCFNGDGGKKTAPGWHKGFWTNTIVGNRLNSVSQEITEDRFPRVNPIPIYRCACYVDVDPLQPFYSRSSTKLTVVRC